MVIRVAPRNHRGSYRWGVGRRQSRRDGVWGALGSVATLRRMEGLSDMEKLEKRRSGMAPVTLQDRPCAHLQPGLRDHFGL